MGGQSATGGTTVAGPATARVLAPAKVNLFLRITGRRADGYHLLDSLMVPVDLYDELAFTIQRGGATRITLGCDRPEIPADQRNLVHAAAELLLAESGVTAAVHVELTKRIPAAAGLGGGSSDAAATLLALNRLLEARHSKAQLAQWAARLGADVPFFIYGRPARVGGVGEIVTPAEGWGGIALVVAFPGVGLSTAAIYRQYDAAGVSPHRPEVSLTNPLPATSIAAFAGGKRPAWSMLVNDLEAVAAEAFPELRSLKKMLMQLGAEGALMTGSGSAVFGVWRTRSAAEVAAGAVRERGVWAVAVQTLEISPAAA
ncbi:MAG: 4-(cytidine 5'-diphospho)-2-C-methyl-D-erythritol kinase [Deltaproteobacteria bacterium]|nr:4-(cytidine 5'-diphospho)-2-C-methyl-D-erythritol kinase [Deltaproteobacteria bacterium]